MKTEKKLAKTILQMSSLCNLHPFIVLGQVGKLICPDDQMARLKFENKMRKVFYNLQSTIPWYIPNTLNPIPERSQDMCDNKKDPEFSKGGRIAGVGGGPSMNMFADTGAGRMKAKGVLEDIIKRKQRELDAYEVLHKAINWDLLSREQEEAIWHLFCHTPWR